MYICIHIRIYICIIDAELPHKSMHVPFPRKIYGKKCAAQVYTLACSILRHTPKVWPAVMNRLWYIKGLRSKDLHRGSAPAAIPTRTSILFSMLFGLFFRNF